MYGIIHQNEKDYSQLARYFAIRIISIVPITEALCIAPVVNLQGSFKLRSAGHLFCPARVTLDDSSWAQVPFIILYAPESTTLKNTCKNYFSLQRVDNPYKYCNAILSNMGLDARKPVFGGLRTTKA